MKFSSVTLPLAVLAAVAFAEKYSPYTGVSEDAILEQFDDTWADRWRVSHAKRDGEFSYVGKWSVEESSVYPALEGDKGLVVKTPAAHHAISHIFKKPFDNKNKDLVLQYEAKFQEGLSCGGAYIKLLSSDGNLDQEFNNDTPYQVMFGPDKCGATNKVHFIVRRKDPNTGEYEEKHLRTPPMARVTKHTTLYTLIIKKDNDFEIRINGDVVKAGNLLDEKLFTPAFNPPKEIDDPTDTKPVDWVDEEEIPDPEQTEKPEDWDEDAPRKIPDPEAIKPSDWDEEASKYIPDPEATKPADWDDEEDGEWVAPEIPNPECENHGCGKWNAPLIPNPDYKGKWFQPLIPNPDYKGEWAPRKISNPDYYEDTHASDLEPIGGLGFELWTMDKDLLFDNIYLGHSILEAEKIGNATSAKKLEIETKKEQEDSEKKVEKAPDAPLNEEEDENDIVQSLTEKYHSFVEFSKSFIDSANDYILELGSNPEYVLREKPIEGLIYLGVFGFLGTILFGVFAIILLKVTSEIDDSVDAKAVPKKAAPAEKVSIKEAQEEVEEDVTAEKIEEENANTSAKTSETTATKRS